MILVVISLIRTKDLGGGGGLRTLLDLMNEYNLTNSIRDPTRVNTTACALIYVILTNRILSFLTSGTFDLGLSDHHLVYAVSRSHYLRSCAITVEKRTFKNYDPERFRDDFHSTPFGVAYIYLRTLTTAVLLLFD